MRRWPDSAWPMCRRIWRSRIWLQGRLKQCWRIGARLFRDTTLLPESPPLLTGIRLLVDALRYGRKRGGVTPSGGKNLAADLLTLD
jgi:hypothetical protein